MRLPVVQLHVADIEYKGFSGAGWRGGLRCGGGGGRGSQRLLPVDHAIGAATGVDFAAVERHLRDLGALRRKVKIDAAGAGLR